MSKTSKTDLPADQRLKISEIFFSLQGEARQAGVPTVFVRLTGCPLRCTYCDTEYAFFGGQWMSFDSLLEEVCKYPAHHVCVTGGEPLAQKNCIGLLGRLCDAGYEVSLETGGAHDVSKVDTRVSKVVDIKTPASGEVEGNRWENLPLLTSHDQIKIVICGRDDYEWARDQLRQRELEKVCEVMFSPAWGQVGFKELAEWILEDGLRVRMQVQLHKLIWGDEPGH
ncbi:MAG: 7-carboxy-7-deazaguanine synthase QueE [Chromatiales bacterium]|nr:7-carboxy-7-deazaguanine synthase QueE [Chromatiales bacterium]